MLTEKDFNSVLIDSMKKQHINILVSFANSFLREFGSVITKDELLKRINKLKYIGFKRPGKYDVVGSADAMYVSSEQVIIISDKNKDKEEKIIKSILYHELIHAVSYHKEKNLDSSINQYEFYRTGLDRQYVEFNTSSDKPGFREGELLEEIMTEYYSTVLLKKEEIDFKGIYVLESYCFDEDYVEYHGAGYQNIAALGQIYDFLFGEELLKAKLYDGNDFRMKFNNMFDSLDVFAHCFTDEGFKVPSYSKFVAQRSVMDRYESACKMFVEIFKKKYGANINSISDLFKNEEFNTFLNMLVKTRNRFVSESKINENLYLLTKKLEKDLAICLFGNEINDNEYGINTSDIETSLYIVINKIYNKNKNSNRLFSFTRR